MIATAQNPQILGAVFDLNGRAEYVHWHFFQMSYANVFVIVAMLIVFALAIALPFPRGRLIAPAKGALPQDGSGGTAAAQSRLEVIEPQQGVAEPAASDQRSAAPSGGEAGGS